MLVAKAFCIGKQYRRRKLIVKETALYVAGIGYYRPRLKAYIVAYGYAERLNVRLGLHNFVYKHFYRVKGALCAS